MGRLRLRCGSLSQVDDARQVVRSTRDGKRRQGSTASLNQRSRKPRTKEAFKTISTGGDNHDPLSLVGSELLLHEYPLAALERRQDDDEGRLQHLQRLIYQQNNGCSSSEGSVDSVQKRRLNEIRDVIPSSSSSSRNTPQNIHKQKMIRKIHGKTRSSAPLCPKCSGNLTYLYISANNRSTTLCEIQNDDDSSTQKLQRLLPPLCKRCRMHLLFENSKYTHLMMENFNEWLESEFNTDNDSELCESSEEEDGDRATCNYNDPRNAKLIVVNYTTVDNDLVEEDPQLSVDTASPYRESRTEESTSHLSNASFNERRTRAAQFDFTHNEMQMMAENPILSDVSPLSDGIKTYRGKGQPGHKQDEFKGEGRQQQNIEEMSDEKRQNIDERGGVSHDYYSPDEDPCTDLYKDIQDHEPSMFELESAASGNTDDCSHECSDASQSQNALSDSQSHDELKLMSLVEVIPSNLLQAQQCVSEKSSESSSDYMKLIRTESEERAVLARYSMKKEIATVQIAKDLIRGYEVTRTKCLRCKMPMMKKVGDAMECVTCPAIERKAKRIAKKKRKEMESTNCSEQNELLQKEEKGGHVADSDENAKKMNAEHIGKSVENQCEIDGNAAQSFSGGGKHSKDSVSLANLEEIMNLNALEEGLLFSNRSYKNGPLQCLGDCSEGVNYGLNGESVQCSANYAHSTNATPSWHQQSSFSASVDLNLTGMQTSSITSNPSDYWVQHSSSQLNAAWHTNPTVVRCSSPYQPSIRSHPSSIEYSLSTHQEKKNQDYQLHLTAGKMGGRAHHSRSDQCQGSSSEVSEYQGSPQVSAASCPSSLPSGIMTIQRQQPSVITESDHMSLHSQSNQNLGSVSECQGSSGTSSTQCHRNLPPSVIVHHQYNHQSHDLTDAGEQLYRDHCNQYPRPVLEVSLQVSENQQPHQLPLSSEITHLQVLPDVTSASEMQLYHSYSNQYPGSTSEVSNCQVPSEVSSTQRPHNLPFSCHPNVATEVCEPLCHTDRNPYQESLSEVSSHVSVIKNSRELSLNSEMAHHRHQSNPTIEAGDQLYQSYSNQFQRSFSEVSENQGSRTFQTQCPHKSALSEIIHCQHQHRPHAITEIGEQYHQSQSNQYPGLVPEVSLHISEPKLSHKLPSSFDNGHNQKELGVTTEADQQPYHSQSKQCQRSSSGVSHYQGSVASSTQCPCNLKSTEANHHRGQSNAMTEAAERVYPRNSDETEKRGSMQSSETQARMIYGQYLPNVTTKVDQQTYYKCRHHCQRTKSEMPSQSSKTQEFHNLPSSIGSADHEHEPSVATDASKELYRSHSNKYQGSISEVSSQVSVGKSHHQQRPHVATGVNQHIYHSHSNQYQGSMMEETGYKMSSASDEVSSTLCPRNIPSSEMIWHHRSHNCSRERTHLYPVQSNAYRHGGETSLVCLAEIQTDINNSQNRKPPMHSEHGMLEQSFRDTRSCDYSHHYDQNKIQRAQRQDLRHHGSREAMNFYFAGFEERDMGNLQAGGEGNRLHGNAEEGISIISSKQVLHAPLCGDGLYHGLDGSFRAQPQGLGCNGLHEVLIGNSADGLVKHDNSNLQAREAKSNRDAGEGIDVVSNGHVQSPKLGSFLTPVNVDCNDKICAEHDMNGIDLGPKTNPERNGISHTLSNSGGVECHAYYLGSGRHQEFQDNSSELPSGFLQIQISPENKSSNDGRCLIKGAPDKCRSKSAKEEMMSSPETNLSEEPLKYQPTQPSPKESLSKEALNHHHPQKTPETSLPEEPLEQQPPQPSPETSLPNGFLKHQIPQPSPEKPPQPLSGTNHSEEALLHQSPSLEASLSKGPMQHQTLHPMPETSLAKEPLKQQPLHSFPETSLTKEPFQQHPLQLSPEKSLSEEPLMQHPHQVTQQDCLSIRISRLADSLKEVADELPRKNINQCNDIESQSQGRSMSPEEKSNYMLEGEHERPPPYATNCSSRNINESNKGGTSTPQADMENGIQTSYMDPFQQTDKSQEDLIQDEALSPGEIDCPGEGMIKSRAPPQLCSSSPNHRKSCANEINEAVERHQISDQMPSKKEVRRKRMDQKKKVCDEDIHGPDRYGFNQNPVLFHSGIFFCPIQSPDVPEHDSRYKYNHLAVSGFEREASSHSGAVPESVQPPSSFWSRERYKTRQNGALHTNNSFGIPISPINTQKDERQFAHFNDCNRSKVTISNQRNASNQKSTSPQFKLSNPHKNHADPPGHRMKSRDNEARDPPVNYFDPPMSNDMTPKSKRKQTSSWKSNKLLRNTETVHVNKKNAIRGQKKQHVEIDNYFNPPMHDDLTVISKRWETSPQKFNEIILKNTEMAYVTEKNATPRGRKKQPGDGIRCPPGSPAEHIVKMAHLARDSITPKAKGSLPCIGSSVPSAKLAKASPSTNKGRAPIGQTKRCTRILSSNETHCLHTGENQLTDVPVCKSSQESVQSVAVLWEANDFDAPLQTTNSFGDSSLGQLFKQIDEIEDDFHAIVASFSSSEAQTITSGLESLTNTENESPKSSNDKHSPIEVTLYDGDSFEGSAAGGDSMVTDVMQRVRRIKDYIEQVDSLDESDGSVGSYDSQGEMSELINRLTNAAESLRALHDDWDN